MTSGNFKTVPISSIRVERASRQRRELTQLEELADSIRKVGLINPVVVNEDLVLIAGERRFTACRDILGWTSIPVQFAEDCSHEELHLIELEENVKRVELTWQDQCRAVEEYHMLRQSAEPGWTAVRTASALGISPAEVSQRIGVARALAGGDERIIRADKYSVARGIIQRQRQRMSGVDEILDALEQNSKEQKSGEAPAVDEPAVEPIVAPPPPPIPLLLADFIEWAPTYTGPKFNFLHCDFPYGINADKHHQGASQALGGYEDSVDVYWNLLSALGEAMPTLVADSAHMMFWFSMDYYQATLEYLADIGWRVNPFPLVWHKSDNTGVLPDPNRGPRRIYETAFLCSRGDRFIAQAVGNVYSGPVTKVVHMSEKSQTMLAHFFRMFVDESTIMLDPTAGSGNAVQVAARMGADSVLGLERDEEFHMRACAHWRRTIGNDTM